MPKLLCLGGKLYTVNKPCSNNMGRSVSKEQLISILEDYRGSFLADTVLEYLREEEKSCACQ